MSIDSYRNFILVVDKRGDGQGQEISVEVFQTPDGSQSTPEHTPIPSDLETQLRLLESRNLNTLSQLVEVGKMLADLLLPNKARQLFVSSKNSLSDSQGLRLQLRFKDPTLATIPWEYMYIARGGGEDTFQGFLALDQRLSIVRHESLDQPITIDITPRPRRLLAVLANPQEPGNSCYQTLSPLDLNREQENLSKVVKELPGLSFDLLPKSNMKATWNQLTNMLRNDADIFHFSGHGEFSTSATQKGKGRLFLEDDEGKPDPRDAEQMAVNLRNRGVNLAVLVACQTGQRDGRNIWSGVAPSFIQAGIPSAVAMQYTIWDESSLAFSKSFYQAIVGGKILDLAVSEGRLSVFNKCFDELDKDPKFDKMRDWGVPVLYLRSDEDFRLPCTTEIQYESTSRSPRPTKKLKPLEHLRMQLDQTKICIEHLEAIIDKYKEAVEANNSCIDLQNIVEELNKSQKELKVCPVESYDSRLILFTTSARNVRKSWEKLDLDYKVSDIKRWILDIRKYLDSVSSEMQNDYLEAFQKIKNLSKQAEEMKDQEPKQDSECVSGLRTQAAIIVKVWSFISQDLEKYVKKYLKSIAKLLNVSHPKPLDEILEELRKMREG